MTNRKTPRNPERSFGVSVGIVLCVIAAALWWRGRVSRAEVLGAIGAVLLIGGLVHPPLLKYPSAVWWRFSRALGYVNARILLTMLFSIVLVPLSTGLAGDRQGSAGAPASDNGPDGRRIPPAIAIGGTTNGCIEVHHE